MATNDFLPFATGDDADVLSQADYAVLPALATGFGTGRAESSQVNKVLRQASVLAAGVAGYIVAKAGTDVLDDGNIDTLVTNLTAAIAQQIVAYGYATLASPAFIGTPTAPTPTTDDNSTKIATTAHVKSAIASKAPIASPAFTGTPTASTPAAGDNSGKLATTGFISTALTAGTGYNTKFASATLSNLDPGGAQVRMKFGNYGVMMRNDGSSWYVLLTPSGQPDGGFNNLRPLSISLSTGAVSIDGSGAGTTFGGAVTLPTPPTSDSSTRAATTAFVKSQGYLTDITGAQVTAALGYTPVRQGGGAGQGSNTVFLGWDGSHPRVQVDATDLGEVAMKSDFPSNLNGIGYKWVGDTLIQWGFATVNNGTVVNFPIAFPNGVLSILTNDDGDFSQGIRRTAGKIIAGNNSQFKGYGQDQNNNFAPTSLKYIAIGH
jgi:hypothetical protein